jgi:hypothetical protein
MGGGLMQLVAYGAQDVYLSGNPQITFFKVVYRRHTNFAVEPIEQTWNGSSTFGRQVTCNINRNGDLITNMYVTVYLPSVDGTNNTGKIPWGYVNRLGHAMIAECKVEIGGSKIDEQWGDWMNIWYELSHKIGQERGYAKMIGDTPELKNLSLTKPETILYIPLQFWFNRNNGLALPLIALQYHDVRVTVYFREASKCVNYMGTTVPKDVTPDLMADSLLLIDYVYLDSEERKRFAQASHEYLIEQLQFTGSETFNANTNKFRLNFNHPSKYLIWVAHLAQYISPTSQWLSYATDKTQWNKALDDFAILITAAAASSLSVTSTVPSDLPYITANISGSTSAGSLVLLNNLQYVSDLIATSAQSSSGLLDMVEVQFIAQTGSTGNSVILALEGQNITNNAIVVRNDLLIEDITWTVRNLLSKNGIPNTSDPSKLLAAYAVTVSDYFNYGTNIDGTGNPCIVAKIQLNGHDRFTTRDGNYFNYVQPYQHFSNTPSDGVNVYSFALKAEDHQPTGTCNFSRIDNATLNINGATAVLGDNSTLLNIYTVNYNVLRVMSGMAGTAYSN